MDISKLPAGRNPPHEINVLIEVPLRSDPIKYEYDKENGFIFVDRYLYTAMFYPCNYGFIPQTLAGDGDPVDVMVVVPADTELHRSVDWMSQVAREWKAELSYTEEDLYDPTDGEPVDGTR